MVTSFSFFLRLTTPTSRLLNIHRTYTARDIVRQSTFQHSMAYQQQPDMRYSQQPQHMPNPPVMQQHQPYTYPNQGPNYQPQPSDPPPQMRIDGATIYNSFTNQPLYAYTLTKAPDFDLPESLLTLRHLPTGITIGTIRRGGASPASTCWGSCSCLASGVDDDVATIGIQGDKAVIKDMGTVRSCWAWKATWAKQGVAGEWAFFEDTGFGPGMVLRDAVSNGRDVLRVDSGGEVKFEDAAAALTEEMVGEIMLILVSLRVNSEDEKQSWLWELLCW